VTFFFCFDVRLSSLPLPSFFDSFFFFPSFFEMGLLEAPFFALGLEYLGVALLLFSFSFCFLFFLGEMIRVLFVLFLCRLLNLQFSLRAFVLELVRRRRALLLLRREKFRGLLLFLPLLFLLFSFFLVANESRVSLL